MMKSSALVMEVGMEQMMVILVKNLAMMRAWKKRGVIPVDLDNVVVITPPNIQQILEDGGIGGGAGGVIGAGGGGGKFNIHPSSSCFSLHALIS